MPNACTIALIAAVSIAAACSPTRVGSVPAGIANEKSAQPATEEHAITLVLNAETAAFFRRDYTAWAALWVHEPYVVKTYLNLSDTTASETVGWVEIDRFARDYLAKHPTPDAVPTSIGRLTARLYGAAAAGASDASGAYVTFDQCDPRRGRKRETRLMEKRDGRWRIAGMHTTIYGVATSTGVPRLQPSKPC